MPVGFYEQFGAPLNPGVLRHQVRWERKVAGVPDGFGHSTPAWELVVLASVQIVSLQGREIAAMQQRWAEANWKIRQHYVAGMSRAQRGVVKIDGVERILEVLDVQDPTGMGREQIIIAKEMAAA